MTNNTSASPADFTVDNPFTLPGFFAAMKDGELVGARCLSCEAILIPPRPACYACGSRELHSESLPKTGEVISYTSVRRPPAAFESLAPIQVAVVELDTGGRLLGQVDASYEDLQIGQRVRLEFLPPEGVPVDSDALLSYERAWPFHVFIPIQK